MSYGVHKVAPPPPPHQIVSESDARTDTYINAQIQSALPSPYRLRRETNIPSYFCGDIQTSAWLFTHGLGVSYPKKKSYGEAKIYFPFWGP